MNLSIIISMAAWTFAIIIYLLITFVWTWFLKTLLDHFCGSYFQKMPLIKRHIIRLVAIMIFTMFCFPLIIEILK